MARVNGGLGCIGRKSEQACVGDGGKGIWQKEKILVLMLNGVSAGGVFGVSDEVWW